MLPLLATCLKTSYRNSCIAPRRNQNGGESSFTDPCFIPLTNLCSGLCCRGRYPAPTPHRSRPERGEDGFLHVRGNRVCAGVEQRVRSEVPLHQNRHFSLDA